MRKYYIFNLKKEFINLYRDYPSTLYNNLKHLYYINKNDIEYGIDLFNQLVNTIDKYNINKDIYIKYHKDMAYSKLRDKHIINNLYKDEVSILTIKNSFMLLESNNNYSSFFNILSKYNENYFVCDFKYQDYFFLSDIKVLV